METENDLCNQPKLFFLSVYVFVYYFWSNTLLITFLELRKCKDIHIIGRFIYLRVLLRSYNLHKTKYEKSSQIGKLKNECLLHTIIDKNSQGYHTIHARLTKKIA